MNEIQKAMLEEKNEEHAFYLLNLGNYTETNYYWIMVWAGIYNYRKILDYVLEKEFPIHEHVYLTTMCEAAKYGHADIVHLLADRVYKNKYGYVMGYAAEGGYIDIVNFLLGLGADDYNHSMRLAPMAKNNSDNIVQIMLDLGANNYSETARNAAEMGNINVVNIMQSKGANNYNEIMEAAALGGNIELVKLMLEKGANNYNGAMFVAANRGHLEIVEFLLEKGARNYTECISNVYLGYENCKKQQIVELLAIYANGKAKLS